MNERLRTLMLEAGYAAPELARRAHKLSELIVKECMNVGNDLAKETFSYSTQPGDIFEYKAHAMEDVVEAIKEHFGIKE